MHPTGRGHDSNRKGSHGEVDRSSPQEFKPSFRPRIARFIRSQVKHPTTLTSPHQAARSIGKPDGRSKIVTSQKDGTMTPAISQKSDHDRSCAVALDDV
jgi:hypothetical protein